MHEIRGRASCEDYRHRGTQPERLAAARRYVGSSGRVLDVGAGEGAYIEALRGGPPRLIGVDVRRFPDWNERPGAWFVQAMAGALPFQSASFEGALCFEVLEHCPDARRVLAEIGRCVSGYLVLSVPNCELENALRQHDLALAHWTDVTHCNFFTKASIQALLRECGYRVVEVSDCYRVCPNDYFWETIRIPRLVAKALKRVCRELGLVETYWSSILVVAETPRSASHGV
jgi:SAM-dependent methyltransferase